MTFSGWGGGRGKRAQSVRPSVQYSWPLPGTQEAGSTGKVRAPGSGGGWRAGPGRLVSPRRGRGAPTG